MYRLLLLLFLVPLTVGAVNIDQQGKHKKSKTISEEFSVNSDATVAIMNKYGKIDVVTWNENRVVLDIVITTSGNNLERVEKRLEQIDVEFDSSSNRVEAKTRIEKSSTNWKLFGNKNNVKFEINYTVKMPSSNSAELNMDYGNISLDELEGNASIDCDYGSISIGELRGSENSINMDYSKNSRIEFVNNASLNADYSHIHIESAGQLNVNADYSHITLGAVRDLEYDYDYGSLKVSDAGSVQGKSDYMNATIDKLEGSCSFDLDYGSLKIGSLGEGFRGLTIKSKYAHNKIGVGNVAFNFTANLSYARMKRSDGFTLNKEISQNSKSEYGGFYLDGASGREIDVTSSYGSLVFMK
jgi:hypothetical protein